MADFAVISAVICDDVRKEASNKDIIIGAYGGGIVVPSFPVNIPFAVWVEVMPAATGRQGIDVMFRAPGIPGNFRLRILVDISSLDDPTTFYTPQVIMPVGEPGNIEVLMKPAETEEWRLIKAKRIIQGVPHAVPAMPEIVQGIPLGRGISQGAPVASLPPSERSSDPAQDTKPSRARRARVTRRST